MCIRDRDGTTLNYTVAVPLKDQQENITGALFCAIYFDEAVQILKESAGSLRADATLIGSKGQIMSSTAGLTYGCLLYTSLLALCVVFLFLYKFVPNRKATFRSQMPGAVFTAVSWSAFSFGFSLYFDYYEGASNMYGSCLLYTSINWIISE